MHRLFETFPRLESERLLLREWTAGDAPALAALTRDPAVYRYLPTFLYEQADPDAARTIARCRAACFDTRDSILLAVCLRAAPDEMLGVAEIYNYEPEKEKASVGYRLLPAAWGRGLATETTALLTRYLLEQTDVRKITAHVMAENGASARVLQKNGFLLRWTGLREDWGRGEPVLVNKFMLKLTPERKAAALLDAATANENRRKGEMTMTEDRMLDRAILFATEAHAGQRRKDGAPFILHPLEDAAIVATMTAEPEILAAAVLHDTVEDTPVTPERILAEFGPRVHALVMHETEDKRADRPPAETWRIRKEETLKTLAETDDPAVKMLWLGDKLSNMRGLYRQHLAKGAAAFEVFNNKDIGSQAWYYGTILELLRGLSAHPAYREYETLYHAVFDQYL